MSKNSSKQEMTYLGKLTAYPQMGVFETNGEKYLVDIYQRKLSLVFWFVAYCSYNVYEISEDEYSLLQAEPIPQPQIKKQNIIKQINKVMGVFFTIVASFTLFQIYAHQPLFLSTKINLSTLQIQIILIVWSVLIIALNFILRYVMNRKIPTEIINFTKDKKVKFYDEVFTLGMIIWGSLVLGALIVFFTTSQMEYLFWGIFLLFAFVGQLGGGGICRVIKAETVEFIE
ncbi:MAG: hypothetical protein LBI11_02915 [Streptococcaceae bacterium]|jgi:uncharacterized membrane protein (TIGR01218 family)|nr:hypothetical protein [Streptococcaceae bacterium]